MTLINPQSLLPSRASLKLALRCGVFVALLLAFCCFKGNVFAQTDQTPRPLELGKPIERELAGGQQHLYQLSLSAGQYLHVVVEQRGIDVVVTLFGPDGKKLLEVDSPNGTDGPEPMMWITVESGTYRLEVRSPEKEVAPARYEMNVLALRAAKPEDQSRVEALALKTESEALSSQGKYDQAISLAERVLKLLENSLGSNHLEIAQPLSWLAELYQAKGEWMKAELAHQRIIEIQERSLGPDHVENANSLNNLAELYRIKGEYKKAEPLYLRSLAITEKSVGPNHQDTATSLNNLALLYYAKGEYAKAEPLYQRAAAILEKSLGPNHSLVATVLNNLASLYLDKDEYVKAGPLFQRAVTIFEKSLAPNHPNTAIPLSKLALMYYLKGEYVKAEPLFQRAVTIKEKSLGPYHPSVATSLNDFAGLYQDKGEYEKAESLFQRAVMIFEKSLGAAHPNVATSLNNLADMYRTKGEYVKAEELLQRALTAQEKARGPNHPLVALSLNNLALLYDSKGEYAKAESFYQRALAIKEEAFGSDHLGIADILVNLAGLYQHSGEYTKAESLFQRALTIKEKWLGPHHPSIAKSLNSTVVFYQITGRSAQALAFQRRAAEASEFNLGRNLAAGSERQKLSYLSLFAGETNRILSLHAQFAPNEPQALHLALTTLLRRKGRALDTMTDLVAILRRRANTEDQSLLDQLASAWAQLSTATLRGPGNDLAAYRSRLKQLEEDIEKLEAEISARSAEFRAQAQAVTLEDVQSAIPKDSVLIEFALYQPYETKTNKQLAARYLAYILTAQGAPHWLELGDAVTIDHAINALRQALRDKTRIDVKQLARAVDAKVMQPVRALLGKTRRVLIAPDGVLNLLPFAALVDEKGHYLVRHYEFSYLTSGRDLLRLQAKQPNKQSAMVVANPDFGDEAGSGKAQERILKYRPGATEQSREGGLLSDYYFPPLSGTAEEARELKALMADATVLTQAQATEAALKRVSSPRILHVATHGFFLEDIKTDAGDGRELKQVRLKPDELPVGKIENPLLRSGLALAGANLQKSGDGDDGILTAQEAAGLDLWGTKMVVLSACETGLGDVRNGEGVYGLRRALVLAGSETQVMSLWPVSDKGTRDLMIEYYRRLLRGEGRSAALREVQLQMLKAKAAPDEDEDRLLVTKKQQDKDRILKTKTGKGAGEKSAPPKPKDYSHPYYWASFIQSGEWANLDGKREQK